MPLAQKLDELALANSQGLLNDDEYRVLRRNLFEQHSNSASVPIEAPIFSVPGSGRTASSHRVRIVDIPTESPASHKSSPSLHRKKSLTAGVNNLLKRGGGGKISASQTPDAPSASPKKPSLILRLHQKASQLLSGRTGDKCLADPPVNASIVPHPSFIDNPHLPNNPLRSKERTPIATFPQLSASSSSEIFDDRNLYTANDIRAAIIATEAEAQRLLEAFNSLESSTSYRVRQQNVRRLRAPTPEHVTAVMDGSNWRKYTPLPLERKVHHLGSTVEQLTDNSSVHSGSSSIKIGLSRSKSISSLRLASPPLARFPTSASSPPSSISRKNSASSIASQARFRATSNMSLSRSTGHLPLGKLVEGEYDTDSDRPGTGDTDNHPEVSEVQRRRDEVMARYNARLEYLQARLRSAELHEKLLRR